MEYLDSLSTHRQHGWVQRAMDGPGVASGIDGEPRELHDRRRRPHHQLICLPRACMAAFQKNLPGGGSTPPPRQEETFEVARLAGEMNRRQERSRAASAAGTRDAARGPASTARRSAARALLMRGPRRGRWRSRRRRWRQRMQASATGQEAGTAGAAPLPLSATGDVAGVECWYGSRAQTSRRAPSLQCCNLSSAP
jgi:hypothetical protein